MKNGVAILCRRILFKKRQNFLTLDSQLAKLNLFKIAHSRPTHDWKEAYRKSATIAHVPF